MADSGAGDRTEVFEGQRRRLFGLAYRLLGSAADADDVLQEAFLRWDGVGGDTIAEPAAWLTRVVTNLCLTELTSARQRRERYTGTWLPEPVLTDGGDLGPLETAQRRESVSMALLLMLEELTPPERAVFILREAFGYRYAEIAAILDRSEGACRQLAHRAAGRVRAARTSVPRQDRQDRQVRQAPQAQDAQRLIDRFLAAATAGDVAGLEELLAEDVISWADGGGELPAGTRPVRGREKVARVFVSLSGALRPGAPVTSPAARKLAGKLADGVKLSEAEVNGSPAVLVWNGDILFTALIPQVSDGRITALYTVSSPGKLAFAARQASRNAALPSQ